MLDFFLSGCGKEDDAIHFIIFFVSVQAGIAASQNSEPPGSLWDHVSYL
jgi:hypothetical protein